MPKTLNQKGLVSPLAIAVIAIVVVGGIYLLNQKSAKPTTNTEQETSNQSQEQTKETVKDKEVIKDVPNPVNEFLNNNDIGEYENAGMKIYTGNNPPNIEGLYKSDSLVIFYDKPFENAAPVGTEVSSYNHKFYDQNPDGTIKVVRQSLEGEDVGAGVGGFISGGNNCFSIFVDVKDKSLQCNTDEATIYSACKVEEGLGQLQAGFIVKENEGTGCGKTVPVGHLRIITEDDGLAEQIKE